MRTRAGTAYGPLRGSDRESSSDREDRRYDPKRARMEASASSSRKKGGQDEPRYPKRSRGKKSYKDPESESSDENDIVAYGGFEFSHEL